MTSSMPGPDFVLYGYFRSSAAFRVRIALNLKGIKPELRFVHLLKGGGGQRGADYCSVNPQQLIPTLVHDGHTIGQSLAIIEYLDEICPAPPLLPRDAAGRARVRQLACMVACDIHPLNNLRVNLYLRDRLGADEEARMQWQHHWMELGFAALETMTAQSPQTGTFGHGDAPTLADICLASQAAGAKFFSVDTAPFSNFTRIASSLSTIDAFARAG